MRISIFPWCFLAIVASSAVQADQQLWQTELARARKVGQGILPEEDAAGAVDGQIRGTFSLHTGQDENPFWQVDLETPQAITKPSTLRLAS